MKMKIVAPLSICLLIPIDTFAGETTFVVGSRPWNFSQRSKENHLTMHMRGPKSLSSTTGGAYGALGQSGPGYMSSSYSIGNWVQVDMMLGDGSEGLIMIENDQINNGNQQSLSDILGELVEAYQTEDQKNNHN